MIFAPDIVKNPQIVDKIESRYQIIYDQSLTKPRLDNINEAINIMAEKGWKCINILPMNMPAVFKGAAIIIYALMEKLNNTHTLAKA